MPQILLLHQPGQSRLHSCLSNHIIVTFVDRTCPHAANTCVSQSHHPFLVKLVGRCPAFERTQKHVIVGAREGILHVAVKVAASTLCGKCDCTLI